MDPVKKIEKEVKEKMQAAIDHFQVELKQLRSSRAHPGMVEMVMVEAYGSHMPIKQLANITTPDARQILITPYERHMVGSIGKAIEKANLNLQPIVESTSVRVPVPPMDTERRKSMVTKGKSMVEETKVTIRRARADGNSVSDQLKSKGEITEDIHKKLKHTIQEMTDQFCKQVEDIFSAKEKEIMAV